MCGITSTSEVPKNNTSIGKSADTRVYVKQNAYFKPYMLYKLML